MDKQLPFSFVGLIVPDRYWWSTIQTNSLRAKRTSTLQPTKPPTTIVLIGCSKSKLDEPAPAQNSIPDSSSRKLLPGQSDRGINGLLSLPYMALWLPISQFLPTTIPSKVGGLTRTRVLGTPNHLCPCTYPFAKGSRAILIMPDLYRRFIQPELDRASISYSNPLERLSIGKQMQWLDSN